MASIRGVVIPVIAALTRTNDPVAAARNHAGAQAAVFIVGVAIIACLVTGVTQLKVGSEDTIAATRRNATHQTGVIIRIVAIITGFVTRGAFRQVDASNPIAASCYPAVT